MQQKGSSEENATTQRSKATTEQLNRSEAAALRSPGSGPKEARSSSSSRKRHSKAMGAPRQHIRRKVRIGVRLPANHDEIAGEVAQQNVVLDLRVLCGTSHAEAHVPVRGSVKRNTCGLNGRLPDAHVTAAVFSGATVDMPEILLRSRAKAAAGGEHNRDEKGIALIVLNNSRDSGAAAPLALTCAEDA